MELQNLFLVLVGWLVVCLPAFVYAVIIDGRRRRDVAALDQKMSALRQEFELLERRLRSVTSAGSVTATHPVVPAPSPEVHIAPQPIAPPPVQPQGAVVGPPPEVRILPQPVATTPSTAATHTAPPAHAPFVAPKPIPPVAEEKPAAPATVEKPVVPSPPPPQVGRAPLPPISMPAQPTETVAVHPVPATPTIPVQPKIAESTSPTPRTLQPESKPATMSAPPAPPPAAKPAATSAAPAGATPAPIPRPPVPAPISPRPGTPAGVIPASASPKPAKRSRSLEETIGTNWLPKVGVVIIVIGLGLLTARAWSQVTSVWQWIGPLGRSAVVLLGGLSMLFGGIAFEKRARYRILGRAMIGGGWATTFLIAYAIRHAPAFTVLSRNSVDLFVLLAVAGVMVWHTLKYNSQTVTGLAFLLAFAAVTLNPDPPFNLIAGALLITGMTVIVLRRQWYELEVFGIVASYGNHFYWLYTAFHTQQTFPDHTASVALVIGYWAIFRASYLLHKIARPRQETISTAAALLNPLLFLGVMKYQSFHPEWAFPALLTMGAMEFILGQLPVSRRRIVPFQILSSLGAALMVIAVPIKYAGNANALALVWLTGAELFLVAGILTQERLFRVFGLIISFLIALYALPVRLAPLAEKILDRQPCHDARLSIVAGVIAFALYANAHLTRRLWKQLFEDDPERSSLTVLSYLAGVFAVAAVYASAPESAVAVIVALFVVILSWLGRRASIPELTYQGHWMAAVAIIQVTVTGATLSTNWLGVPARMLTFAGVAAALYLSSRFVRLSQTANLRAFSAAYAWSATALLTLLVWFQGPAWAVAVLWIVLGLALSLAGHGLQRSDLKWQAFVLMWMAAGRALAFNFDLAEPSYFHSVSMRLNTVSLVALGTYLLAAWAPRAQMRAIYTVIATSLVGFLIFKEAPSSWVAFGWIVLALALSVAARWIPQVTFKPEELKWQAFVLVFLAAVQSLEANFELEKPLAGISLRLITVSLTALGIYMLARWAPRTNLRLVYTLIGTSLLGFLIFKEVRPAWVVVGWMGLALALAAGEVWLKHLVSRTGELKWQGLVLAVLSFAWAWGSNLEVDQPFYFTSLRLVTVSLTALGIYLLARWAPIANLRPLYSVMGTLLLSALAFRETKAPWTGLAWISLAVALGLAARWWRDRPLLWQTHALAALAAGWTLFANFAPQYRGSRAQLISVGVTSILLYVLTRITNVAGVIEDYRMTWAYPWAGSLLLSWLVWFQVDAVGVSLVWGVFGLVLFELPDLVKSLGIEASKSAANWRAQAYVALFSSFAHLFYANFNSTATGGFLHVLMDPRLVTAYPLVPFYFWVYWRVYSDAAGAAPPEPHVATKAVNA